MLCCAKQIWIAMETLGGGPVAVMERGSVKGSPRMLADRPIIHGVPSRMEVFTIKKANPTSKRV
jgi:hypothetical protein